MCIIPSLLEARDYFCYNAAMDEMIIRLQEAIAHQGEDILRLSDELYTQQKEIADLRRQLQLLHAKLKAASEEGTGIRPANEETPPPHY